jgi:hypothetical protein
MRTFIVTVGTEDGAAREIRVPAKTVVQAGDAALTQMREEESVLDVRETDDPYQQVDTAPPGSQTHPDQIT